MQEDLFGAPSPDVPGGDPLAEPDASAPLADRMRPRSLEDYVGQRHLTAEGKVLARLLALTAARGLRGNQGTNALVEATYSAYSGLVPTSFFSSITTPDTLSRKRVIRSGLNTVHADPGVARAMRKKPHQTAASPK